MKITDRTYGVEIEILETGITRSQIAEALRSAGIEAQDEDYNHTTRSYWKVITDGSCGFEVVSPILSGNDGFDQIRRVSEALVSINAQVDKRCGLHVHFGANDLTKLEIAAVLSAYARYEKFFDAIQPPSRRNNQYCNGFAGMLGKETTTLKKNPFRFYGSEMYYGRYMKLNLESYVRHGTIEFRQGAGTIESKKIINWIVLLLGFVEEYRSHSVTLKPVQVWYANFCFHLGLSKKDSDPRIAECAEWVSERFHKFSPTATVRTLL